MFLYSNEIRLFQRNVPVYTQLKCLIDAMKTSQQRCVELERVSYNICLNLAIA